MLLPLVQRHVAVPHPPRHSRAEALGEPAPERVVCELHLPLVGPHHLCQRAVGVPPVSPAVLLAVKPPSRTEVAFRQVPVRVVLAVPFAVLLQPSATKVTAQLHVRVGIQVSRLVALPPLHPAVGVFRPFELPRRGVGVACLATPAVLHGQQPVGDAPAVAAHMPCARVLACAGIHQTAYVIIGERADNASRKDAFHLEAQRVVAVCRFPRASTVAAAGGSEPLKLPVAVAGVAQRGSRRAVEREYPAGMVVGAEYGVAVGRFPCRKSQGVVRELHRAFTPRCLHQPAGQPVGVGLVGVAGRGV